MVPKRVEVDMRVNNKCKSAQIVTRPLRPTRTVRPDVVGWAGFR